MSRRLGTACCGSIAAFLLIPAATSACTQEEYLTDEERASGRYDNTPPAYEQAWGSGQPHSHEPVNEAPAEAPTAEAPADAENAAPRGSERGRNAAPAPRATRPDSPDRRISQPRGESDPAPAPHPTPRSPVPQPAAPVGSLPQHVVSAPDDQAVAAQREPRAKRRAVKRSFEQRGTRGDRPPDRVLAAPAAAAPARAASGSWVAIALVAALTLLGLGGAAAAVARLRRPVPPDSDADAAGHDALLEAELQELIAEERARAAAIRERDPPQLV